MTAKKSQNFSADARHSLKHAAAVQSEMPYHHYRRRIHQIMSFEGDTRSRANINVILRRSEIPQQEGGVLQWRIREGETDTTGRFKRLPPALKLKR